MHIQGFYVSEGNRKGRFPVVSSGSGTDCPSAAWCPFSAQNYKASGRNQCYAQVCERVYVSALKSRRQNARIIAEQTAMMQDNADTMGSFTASIAMAIDAWFRGRAKRPGKAGTWRKKYGRIVRLNEAGDICNENIAFHVSLIRTLRSMRIRVYMYSKAHHVLQDMCREAGAVVLQSERDFVAVKRPEQSPLPLCKGSCGPCKRCPMGMQSAIIEH